MIQNTIRMFYHENKYLKILRSQKYIINNNNTVSVLVPQNGELSLTVCEQKYPVILLFGHGSRQRGFTWDLG
jgi:translation elongation factor EF-Ts